MKVNFHIPIEPPPQRLRRHIEDHARAINGNIEFGNLKDGATNISGSWQQLITPGVADTEFTLTHNLGRVPEGFLVVSIDQAAIIYSSRKAQWSTTQLFLKANLPSVVLTAFVI